MSVEKNITAKDVSYGNLYGEGPQYLLIPTMQRPYVWSSKQIDQLLNDIQENKPGYFVGTIVVVPGPNGTQSEDEVIDGQQRLTTLSLMLRAIRDAKKLYENQEAYITQQLITSAGVNLDVRKFRLNFSNTQTNSIYQKIILGDAIDKQEISDGQKRMLQNYEYLCEKMNELQKTEISNLYEKIIDTQFILITCGDEDIAYNLFESINATGISLASTDLIKNAIFREVSSDNSFLQKAESLWDELEYIFDGNHQKIKMYLRHQWLSAGRYTSHSKLFADFSETYLEEKDNREKVMRYLEQVVEDAKIYVALRTSDIKSLTLFNSLSQAEKNDISTYLRYLRALRLDQAYPILLYVYRKSRKPSSFSKFLVRVCAFHVLFKHVPGNPNFIEKRYAKLASEEGANKSYDENKLFKELEKAVDYESDFIESFSQKTKYSKQALEMSRFPLELYMRMNGGPLVLKNPTVEHIIPQGGKGKEGVKNIHNLGNLTLLEKQDNSSERFSDKSFKEKVEEFDVGSIEMNKKIKEYPFGSNPNEAIQVRSQKIAEELYPVFRNALKSGKFDW